MRLRSIVGRNPRSGFRRKRSVTLRVEPWWNRLWRFHPTHSNFRMPRYQTTSSFLRRQESSLIFGRVRKNIRIKMDSCLRRNDEYSLVRGPTSWRPCFGERCACAERTTAWGRLTIYVSAVCGAIFGVFDFRGAEFFGRRGFRWGAARSGAGSVRIGTRRVRRRCRSCVCRRRRRRRGRGSGALSPARVAW